MNAAFFGLEPYGGYCKAFIILICYEREGLLAIEVEGRLPL